MHDSLIVESAFLIILEKLALVPYIFFRDFIYLFVERGEGREKERERNIICGCLLHAPYWGPGLQPRHVPYLGIKLAILWFAGWHSIH